MAVAKKNIIYQGNSIISVENLPDYSHPVVIKKLSKKHSSQQKIRSLEKEYEMTQSLNAVEGVRKVLEQKSIDNQPALILEYIDGETLRDYIKGKTLDLRERLKIAVELVRIIEKIHQQNIIHLDFNSKNIIIATEQETIHLIDLGSASRIKTGSYHKVQPDQMLGTLQYISPEQTGRINRAVDERSDLYSLGVVLYEMMTGQLPFDSKDPSKIVHHHIARVPVSPSTVSEKIPQVLSSIILKLLSKKAEDRYQSAAGVQADLDKCLQRLIADNTIEEFTLGEIDYSSRFKFPQKLYGRESELNELVDAFKIARSETPLLFFVGGYSGIGKTTLIEEIQKPVSENKGCFIRGKFDQYLRTKPYSGLTKAFERFISQILAEPEKSFNEWRDKITDAVGNLGRVLTDVIPALEELIGSQPDVPQLSGQEAENRFNYVFINFLSAAATKEHPLAIFIDDLQWIDAASLRLLKVIETDFDQPGLLVIGAYRDNEVDNAHPLMDFINEREEKSMQLRLIKLSDLSEHHLEALLRDTLKTGEGIEELEEIIFERTHGNPFFSRRLLTSLNEEGRIDYDSEKNKWIWNIAEIKSEPIADNVADLLTEKIAELPDEIKNILTLAACIGHNYDIQTLALISGLSEPEVIKLLTLSISGQYVVESRERFEFVHDRVQEAAYALLPPEDRDRTHLMIGWLLLKKYQASDHEQDLYQIVDQLNHGLHLVEDEHEQMQLARLNHQAARSARHASAFETGLHYARAGIELLGEDAWERHYRLTLQLHEQAALLAYSVGDIPAMEQHSKQVLQFGRDPHDLGQIQRLHIEFLLSSKRFDEAIDFGLKALHILGQEFLPEPDWAFTTEKLSKFLEHLEQRPPDFVSIPRLYDQDPELLSISDILFSLGSAAYIYRPAMAPLMYMRSLELSLERQLLSDHTPTLIIGIGIFANALLGKVELAHAYGEVAMELASRATFQIDLNAVLHIHALHIHFWRKPLRETLGLFDRAVQSAHDFGSNEYASYARHGWSKHAVYASIELAQVEESSLKRRTFLDAIQNVTVGRWINIYVTAVQALRGNSSAQGSTWRGTPFDDDRDIPDLQRVGDQNGLLYAYCAKAWIATLFGDHSGVKEYSDLSHSFIMASPTGVEKAILTFVCGLRHARELRVTPENTEIQLVLQEQLGLLERFADLAPMNFGHKLSLVRAEVHRARGEILPAMKAYEQASHGARENGHLNEEGLVYALATEFYQDLGLHQAALNNLEQATLAWQNWGAHALVENLSLRFPDLLETSGLTWQSSTDADNIQTSIAPPVTSIQLDMDSIISASQMLSAEIDLEELLTKMITLVMANSGAEKAVLLLMQDNDWLLQARGDSSSEKYDILLNQPFDPADSESYLIPESVFNYCRRSNEVLVVGNAKLDKRFGQDRTIQTQHVLSLACIPVLSQGKLKAMLYLENCQLADVFTPERQQIIKHLSSQFGISVENALLYDRLNSKKRELQISETRFRSLVENAEETIVVAQDDLVKYANVKTEELTGYPAEEMTKMGFEKFIHPDDLNTVFSEYQDRLSGEKPANKYSIRLISKHGQTKYVYVNSALIDWDGRPATLALITDITQLKNAEEKVRRAYDEIKALKDQLQAESEYLREEIKLEHNFENIIGNSPSLKYVLNRVEQIARTDSPVLIMGETGTGKELVARAIHKLCPFHNRALVKVNCAALPRELIESELFGHEKGAFTGAVSKQIGRFEIAKNSTLFLDEIGELPLELQAKLLRVLDSGEFERLGSSRTIRSNARIIAATNRVLEEEVFKGNFREDLWYRLKVFPISVPPLRERTEDIPLLVNWFVDRLSRKMNINITKIPKSNMKMLQNYPWPGNVRELEHTLENALITAKGNRLNFELPRIKETKLSKFKSMEEMEREYIIKVLEAKNWKVGGENSAASILGMHVNTLRGRMEKFGIKKPKINYKY